MTPDDLVERVARACTCHPSEAPVPCRKQYAFLDCIRAEARAIALEEAAKVAENFPARTHGNLATAPYAAAEQAAEEIAAAIRAMIPSGAVTTPNDNADSK